MPDGRSMGMFIILPDATMLLTCGVNTGTAGYGNDVSLTVLLLAM